MSHDAAAGAVLGALVGDAAGAVLEFLGRRPTGAEVEKALGMPGGGVWGVAPGQITDDGELTLCLLRALDEANGFDIDVVAARYVDWYLSPPFDIGATTSTALQAWQPEREGQVEGAGAALLRAAAQGSMGSKANGSLMRCSPLGVWGSRLEDEALATIARADSALTHPNPSCADAVAAYALAIASLVRAPDRERAWKTTMAWASKHACPDVRDWLALAERGERVPFHPQIGFVKIAFVEAFRHLRAGSGYVDAIRETLAGGGDTDTNACIVGGLIGAAVGESGIPEPMRRAVLECDTARGRERPAFLHPRLAIDRIRRISRPPA